LDHFGLDTAFGSNVFNSPLDFWVILLVLAGVAYLIYRWNRDHIFKHELNAKDGHITALLLGIFTTPYVFLLPASFV